MINTCTWFAIAVLCLPSMPSTLFSSVTWCWICAVASSHLFSFSACFWAGRPLDPVAPLSINCWKERIPFSFNAMSYLVTGKTGREKIWLHVSSPWAKSPAVRHNLTQSISIFYCVFEFFWLSGPRRSVLFSSRAVLVFPALSLDAYGLHTGLFFLWFSNEISRGAERLIWLKKIKLLQKLWMIFSSHLACCMCYHVYSFSDLF